MLSKRKHHLVARPWEVEAGGTSAADTKAAALVEDVLGALPFDGLCLDLCDATLKGFSVAEIVWMRDGAHVVPEKIVAHDPRRFVFDPEWRPRLLTREAMADGIVLPERNFIVHRFGVRGNNPYGLGLGTRLFWAVLFKREGVAFWLHFMERFAAPVPVGKHPMGMLPDDQQKLLGSLGALAQGAAILVPIGTELEFLEAKRAGEAGYEAWCRYWDEQISECVLGETLTTNIQGAGSRAASETHADILDQLVDADADLLSGTFNESLLAWLAEYNVPGARPPRVWRPRPENEAAVHDARTRKAAADVAEIGAAEKLAAFLDRLQAPGEFVRLMEVAASGADGLVVEVLRAAVATTRQPLLREPATPPAASDAGGGDEEPEPADDATAFASPIDRLFACPVHFAAGDEPNALTASVAAAAAPAVAGWIAALRDAVDEAGNFAAVSDALLIAAPRLPLDAFAEALGDGLALAELVGMAEVADEAGDTVDAADRTSGVAWGAKPFDEAVAFLRQKVALPSKRWTDLLHAGHDRAFVVAGATSVALVEDLKAAVVRIEAEGGTLADFRRDFSAIVERHGWAGWTGSDSDVGRAWRTRVILETNLRTAHQAGRLRQMRAVADRRPWWQYRHGVLRSPKSAREAHQALHGRVFRHDDPVWATIYPPNGWFCTCGVRTLAEGDLARLGKAGGDRRLSAAEVEAAVPPEWRHAPGDTWERGLVPPALQQALPPAGTPTVITTEPPLAALARPSTATRMPAGQDAGAYAVAFLAEFGAAVGRGALFRDAAGQVLTISYQLFDGAGVAIGPDALRLAEALRDPDEIWVDWAGDATAPRLVRRYLRAAPGGDVAAVEWAAKGWVAEILDAPASADARRRGALLFRRP